jgi:hypothetical protein
MYEKVKGKLPNDGASTRKEKKIVCLEKKATRLNTISTSERRSLLLFGSSSYHVGTAVSGRGRFQDWVIFRTFVPDSSFGTYSMTGMVILL